MIPYFNHKAASVLQGFYDSKDAQKFYLTGVERFNDYDIVASQKEIGSDPAQLKMMEKDLLTMSIAPVSSFEVTLYAKHKY